MIKKKKHRFASTPKDHKLQTIIIMNMDSTIAEPMNTHS